MSRRAIVALASVPLISAGLAAAAIAAKPGPALLPGKSGGVLNVLTREDLAQGFSIHESATLSTIWPAQPCFNNSVTLDPVKALESFNTVVPELVEKLQALEIAVQATGNGPLAPYAVAVNRP